MMRPRLLSRMSHFYSTTWIITGIGIHRNKIITAVPQLIVPPPDDHNNSDRELARDTTIRPVSMQAASRLK